MLWFNLYCETVRYYSQRFEDVDCLVPWTVGIQSYQQHCRLLFCSGLKTLQCKRNEWCYRLGLYFFTFFVDCWNITITKKADVKEWLVNDVARGCCRTRVPIESCWRAEGDCWQESRLRKKITVVEPSLIWSVAVKMACASAYVVCSVKWKKWAYKPKINNIR